MRHTRLLLFLALLPSYLITHAQVLTQDSLALVALYNATGGSTWTNNTNWLQPGQNVSTWYGIDVFNTNRVRQIVLYDNNLTGSLPEEISDLTKLRTLLLGYNHLSGTIPVSMSNMLDLFFLDLSGNDYEGNAPSQFFNMPLPVGVGGTPRIVLLSENNFTGFSPWNGEFKYLRDFAIEGNDFDFGDLEPLFPNTITLFFLYSPQDSIYSTDEVTVYENSVITLKTGTGGSVNHYQWLKNNTILTAATQADLTLTSSFAGEGVYTAQVTNDIVTGLTLERKPITLRVKKDTVYTSCDGTAITLNATVLDAQATYLWSTGATGSSIMVNASGKYSVQIETANYILKDTLQAVLLPKLSLGPDIDACTPSLPLSSNAVGADSYEWQTPGGTLSNQSTLTATESGRYVLKITREGCIQKDTINVILNHFTPGDFNMMAGSTEVEDNGIVLSEVALTFTNTTGTGANFNWLFDENTSAEESPTYTFTKAGQYAVTLSGVDSRNCPITVAKIITVEDLVITNAISPNGDGKNDKLFIEPFLYNAELKIINRWGQSVYETSSYNNDFTGANLESGVYYYELNFKDVDKRFKGYVHVMKDK